MVASVGRFLCFVAIVSFTVVGASLPPVPVAATDGIIRIWRVGDPHTAGTPNARVPAAFAREAAGRGWRIAAEAFPPNGFADVFRAAAARGDAPDILVFDNYGVMIGMTTKLGTFEGIGEDAAIKAKLVRVTGAFDALLGPRRGWTYLFRPSTNYDIARELALRQPGCTNGPGGPALREDLAALVPRVAKAYLELDEAALQAHVDPDRLPTGPSPRIAARVARVVPCGLWGNDTLAFVSVNTITEADAVLGNTPTLLAFRNVASRWQLLAASRDPISNGAFVTSLSMLDERLAKDSPADEAMAAATLLSPPPGVFPAAAAGQRFGNFGWRSSASREVIAEVIEFSYDDDARLFVRPVFPGMRSQMSAGALWSTQRAWNWRVWSIARDGEIAFSEARDFVH